MNSIGGMGWHNLPLTNKWTAKKKSWYQGSWLSHYPNLVVQHCTPRGSSTYQVRWERAFWTAAICMSFEYHARCLGQAPVECWCLWLQRDVPTFINFERDLLIWFDTFPKFERTCSTHFHTFPYVYIFRRVYLSLWELFGAKKKSALRGDHVTTLFQGPNHREALKRVIPNSWLFISWKIR